MASLSSSARLGNTSASSLIRSSQSIQSEINTYNDSLAAYQYELSPKTDDNLGEYQQYLQARIDRLQSTGSITDINKALTLTKTMTSAQRSNSSANIQRENIDVMSGNATLQDKYDTIVGQYQRATASGDLSLAQQLESQAYSVSQTIQYQQQQAIQAGQALASAAQAAKISDQTAIVGSLKDALAQLNNDVKNLGVKDLNKTTEKWVDANRDILQSLGTVIPKGAQPNYFDLVEGIQAAQYNALVLRAQAESVTNPATAQNTMRDATLMKNGGTKISTLAGSLTLQEIQQAAQDPSMFAYDYGSNSYKRTEIKGYQYVNGQVAPSYSGVVGAKQFNQMVYLNPNETATMTGLGINFSMDTKGARKGSANDGVQIQLTEDSPDWLRNILGENGVAKAYVGQGGDIRFEGPSSRGDGLAYFSLINVGGSAGIFEHSADGSTHLVGGNYGFDAGAAQLLVNMGQQKQYQIQLQTKQEQAAQAAQLKLATPQPLPQVNVAPTQSPASIAQKTVSPQTTSVSPQNASTQSTNILQPAGQRTSNVQGIPLKFTSGPSIRL